MRAGQWVYLTLEDAEEFLRKKELMRGGRSNGRKRARPPTHAIFTLWAPEDMFTEFRVNGTQKFVNVPNAAAMTMAMVTKNLRGWKKMSLHEREEHLKSNKMEAALEEGRMFDGTVTEMHDTRFMSFGTTVTGRLSSQMTQAQRAARNAQKSMQFAAVYGASPAKFVDALKAWKDKP